MGIDTGTHSLEAQLRVDGNTRLHAQLTDLIDAVVLRILQEAYRRNQYDFLGATAIASGWEEGVLPVPEVRVALIRLEAKGKIFCRDTTGPEPVYMVARGHEGTSRGVSADPAESTPEAGFNWWEIFSFGWGTGFFTAVVMVGLVIRFL